MNCDKVYIGETGRKLGTRVEEHKKDTEIVTSNKQYTRSQRQSLTSTINKSAVTDHVATNNHVIDWKGTKIVDREQHRPTRWIRESIWIRKHEGNIMNRDEGGYKLSRIYDNVLTKAAPPSSRNRQHSV